MNRKAAACLSVLLLVFQTVALPIASALAQDGQMVACDHGGAVHGWHRDDGCGGDSLPGSDGNPGCHRSEPAQHCGCIHTVPQTPAASRPVVVPTLPAQTTVVTGRLQGAAYPSPQYDFLRPPD